MEKQNVAGVMPARRTFLSIRQLTVAGFLSAITIFRPYGLWFHPAGHHERDNPSHPDYHRQPDGRPQGRHDRRLHVRYLSFIRSLQAPSALLLFAVQYNVVADAFICIVPRILIAVTAVLTTVCHTILFLGSFTAIVGVPYAEAQGIPFMNVINIMLGITAVNGIPEAIVSGLIITPIVMALHRAGLKVA